MEITTKVHTIFMLIGSTECGKTTFAKHVLIPQLGFEDAARGVKANVQYLSSDGIRQELLGYEYDKYDQVMLEASAQAFQLLYERLRMVTSFPVNADFVVVDTTGLAEDFREKVREIAKANHYNLEVILFDYKKREDYYASERSKKLITAHINRLRKEVLGSLAREQYGKIHKVRANDFLSPVDGGVNPEYKVNITNKDELISCSLPQDGKYIVVGDVHECVDELKELLVSFGFELDGNRLIHTDKTRNTKVLLAGDWIDKGGRTGEIIEFLYDNQDNFLFVMGNHENFVSKYMKGDIKGVEQELLDHFFDSTKTLSKDKPLLAKFDHLVSLSKSFYRLIGTRTPSFYVTHAPCENKYIGKLDSDSERHQRNFRIDRDKPLEEQLPFLKRDAVGNHPYHLFGHIAAQQSFRIKNKIHIDTGVVQGNALTGVILAHKLFFKTQKAGAVISDEPLPLLFKEERKVSLQELSDEDSRRLQYISNNKINFVSGTMSPADKDEAAGELESLARGLDYFANRGIHKVVLQPKYMGSRCNVYLHRELEQCFAVSRNGYKINAVDMAPVYEVLLGKLGSYMEKNEIELLLLDGELLPWLVLGDGLIQRQFKPIGKALETELAHLAGSGFDEALGKLLQAYEESGFEKDQHHLAKNVLSEKYGANIYQSYKHVADLRGKHVPLHEHIDAYETYKKQLELYAEAGELSYKPFALLKVVYQNGEELLPDWPTSEMYRFLSDDEFVVLDLSEAGSYEAAERYFSKLTVEQHMEGVVIKPEEREERTLPYMKVRNKEYLSIIYGYDYRFPHKYGKLMKQKNIQLKARTSLNEHRLGNRMLAIPFADINTANESYRAAAAELLFETAKEKEIDPRL
ncbi:metallophosphoesterase [Paenibacillus sp. YIM B09110]|uniref:metallophosphoesterase n=1 Tax=Paenibacillus sp. YIM B09110 TaxID=3126102 RepID=UPI00301DE903